MSTLRKLLFIGCFLVASVNAVAQTDSDNLNNQGVELLENQDYSEALPIFNLLVLKNPETTMYRYNRAVTLFNLHKYKEALADYEYLHRKIPEESEYAFQIGNCYENLDSTRQAIRYYTIAINTEKEYFMYFFKRGTIYLKDKQWKNAEMDFNESLQLNPAHSNSFHNRGIALYHLGQKSAACNDWCQAVAQGNQVSKSHVSKNCTQACK